MRIGLDATPLIGSRTGVGRYVAELVRHLPEALQDGDELVATAFTLRGAGHLLRNVPAGVSVRNRRVPARLLQYLWARTPVPSVRLLAGPVEAFHATNFVLPPLGRARGVVTVHDLAYLRLPATVSAASRQYAHLVPRSVARAAVVCVPSEFVAGEVSEAYPGSAAKVVVTPLGVDAGWADAVPTRADRLAELGLGGDYLLFVGNLEPRKDLATVLAAYRLLVAKGRTGLPQLALAGPSGWGGPLDLTGLADFVVRLGPLPEPELRGLVAGARALLYPSRYEGFGLPVLEAFACGTPLIASDLPTTRELLGTAGDLAALFPVGDVESLAELLVADPVADAASRERRRDLAASWSWSRTATLTAAAYRRALG
jgi:glycosyltransferase involved in cell wall biosynthesis